MSMTKLEEALAIELTKVMTVDVKAIIEAAQAACIGGPSNTQTVQETPVTTVQTAAPETENPKRARKTEATQPVGEQQAPAPAPVPEEKPVPPPAPAATPPPPAPETAQTPGVNLTGLFEGSGPSKKVVKAVFLEAVEKAGTLAAMFALNDMCDCGIDTTGYTEETAAVLRRRMTRWGMQLM